MIFEEKMKEGNFLVGECTSCQKIVWPPSEFCNKCFKEIQWRKGSENGRVVEFSKINDNYLCLVEFENTIKIMGKLTSGFPSINQRVKIKRCGIKKGSFFFEFSLV